MPTGHWLTAGGNTSWSAGQSFTNYDVAVPAGGRLVRVLAKHIACMGNATNVNWPAAPPVALDLTVALRNGTYGTREIFGHSGALRQTGFALYDFVTTQRVYSVNYTGADDTLGFNHECSYGGPGHQVNTVRFTWQVLGNPSVGAASGNLQIVFMALYIL
jgi:hypothetical protein